MRMRLERLETVCIVDANGFPLALQRMDDARFTGPQIAWNKAFTAAGHRRSTHLFNTPPDGPALPGNEEGWYTALFRRTVRRLCRGAFLSSSMAGWSAT